ncbi:Imm1 family immunity protein [Actinosynnema sp. CS-041913]|uniref:Imm1 family immunity protein n=1 Tax=Actinosynnema sp. CS-041913 TaxID=3239917 RepID=UPI003D93AAC6
MAQFDHGKGDEVASLPDVAAGLSNACDKASQCRDALGQAQDLAEEAHALLANALTGSHGLDADAEQMLARFTEVVNGVTDLWKILGKGLDHAQALLATLTGSTGPPPAATTPPSLQQTPPAQRLPARQADPPILPSDEVERLRRKLPPSVVPDTGRKTHRWWIGSDGQARKIVSERDSRSDLVERQLAEKGLRRKITRSGVTQEERNRGGPRGVVRRKARRRHDRPHPGRAGRRVGHLNVGVHGGTRRGALYYAEDGAEWFSVGEPEPSGRPADRLLYYYMNNSTEFPGDCEIPLDVVRLAAHEYMTTGGERPTVSAWQPAPDWW